MTIERSNQRRGRRVDRQGRSGSDRIRGVDEGVDEVDRIRSDRRCGRRRSKAGRPGGRRSWSMRRTTRRIDEVRQSGSDRIELNWIRSDQTKEENDGARSGVVNHQSTRRTTEQRRLTRRMPERSGPIWRPTGRIESKDDASTQRRGPRSGVEREGQRF